MRGRAEPDHVTFKQSLKLLSILIFNAALFVAFLKSCKYFCILSGYMKTFLSFYFEQLQSMNIAIPISHLRGAEIPFYIENPRRFSNSVNGDYKLDSHDKRNKLVCRHFD
jgi:hypothetical protein